MTPMSARAGGVVVGTYGYAGALVTADRGIDLPTAPVRYRDHLADVESKWAFRSPIPPPARPAKPARPVRRRRYTEPDTGVTSLPGAGTMPHSDVADPSEAVDRAEEGRACARSVERARPTRSWATTPRPAGRPRPSGRRPSGRPAAAAGGRVHTDAAAAPSGRQAGQVARGVLVEQLRTRWAAGQSRARIADELGISVTTVQRLRRLAGLAARRTPLDRAEVARLYAVHRSVERVADLLGTGPAAVRYQLARARVALRAPGDNGRRRPDTDRAAVLAAYQAGQPVADIYSRYAISETTLARWRHDAGIPTRGQQGAS